MKIIRQNSYIWLKYVDKMNEQKQRILIIYTFTVCWMFFCARSLNPKKSIDLCLYYHEQTVLLLWFTLYKSARWVGILINVIIFSCENCRVQAPWAFKYPGIPLPVHFWMNSRTFPVHFWLHRWSYEVSHNSFFKTYRWKIDY